MMTTMVVVRVDDDLRMRLARIARRRKATVSAMARRALMSLVEQEEAELPAAPHEILADLLGCVHGGDRRRSVRGAGSIASSLRSRRARS